MTGPEIRLTYSPVRFFGSIVTTFSPVPIAAPISKYWPGRDKGSLPISATMTSLPRKLRSAASLLKVIKKIKDANSALRNLVRRA